MTSGEPHFGQVNDRGARVIKGQDGPLRMAVSTGMMPDDSRRRFVRLIDPSTRGVLASGLREVRPCDFGTELSISSSP